MGNQKHTILFVDDEKSTLHSLRRVFNNEGYNILTAENGKKGIELVEKNKVSLVISDNLMPEMQGIEFLSKIKLISPDTVRFMFTAYTDVETVISAINRGEVSRFIIKPWNNDELKLSIKDALLRYELLDENKRLSGLTRKQYAELAKLNKDLERRVEQRTSKLIDTLNELEESNEMLGLSSESIKKSALETIHKLTLISEYKDRETAFHVRRISYYASFVAKELGLPDREVEMISYASPLHDIGKVGIPSEILLKAGKLTSEEFALMKTHAKVGANILQGSNSEFLQMGEKIALTHHERWNGNGYPNGLKGTEISLEGRIVNFIDQYDALRSPRPYKFGFDHERTYKIITEGDGRTEPEDFDPRILELFKDTHNKFKAIFDRSLDEYPLP